MDLQEFVSESLKQLVDGVRDAQEHAAPSGAKISPMMHQKGPATGRYSVPEGGGVVQNISFDVAVTAQEKNEQGGKAGLNVPYFNFGGKLSAEQENATISRIKFEVPVVLPSQRVERC